MDRLMDSCSEISISLYCPTEQNVKRWRGWLQGVCLDVHWMQCVDKVTGGFVFTNYPLIQFTTGPWCVLISIRKRNWTPGVILTIWSHLDHLKSPWPPGLTWSHLDHLESPAPPRFTWSHLDQQHQVGAPGLFHAVFVGSARLAVATV